MIRINGMRYDLNSIKYSESRGRNKSDSETIDIDSMLYLKLWRYQNSKNFHGVVCLKPTHAEVANFSISTELHSHPFYEDQGIVNGPQISWVQVYPGWEGKGIATSLYHALVKRFGVLYSDYEQTFDGTALWNRIIRLGVVDVFAVTWSTRLDRIKEVQEAAKTKPESWFHYKETLLVARKKA